MPRRTSLAWRAHAPAWLGLFASYAALSLVVALFASCGSHPKPADPPCTGASFSAGELHPIECSYYTSYWMLASVDRDAGGAEDAGPPMRRPRTTVQFGGGETDTKKGVAAWVDFDDVPESGRAYALDDPAIRSVFVQVSGSLWYLGGDRSLGPRVGGPDTPPELEATAVGRIRFANLATAAEVHASEAAAGDTTFRFDQGQEHVRFEIRLVPNDPSLPGREIVLER